MFTVVLLAVVSGLGRINFTSMVNLNFWSRAIFRSLPLPRKVHRCLKKMTCDPIHLWFLSYLGWLLWKPQFWNQCVHFIYFRSDTLLKLIAHGRIFKRLPTVSVHYDKRCYIWHLQPTNLEVVCRYGGLDVSFWRCANFSCTNNIRTHESPRKSTWNHNNQFWLVS